MRAIKSLTDSWLWSAKGFPFFLFKRFKGNKIDLNQRAWLPLFNFPFMADMLAVLRAVNALASLLLTRRKSLRKVSGCSGGRELTGRALLLHHAGLRRNCLFRQSSLYLTFALCLSQQEINTNMLHFCNNFVYVREHIWASEYTPMDGKYFDIWYWISFHETNRSCVSKRHQRKRIKETPPLRITSLPVQDVISFLTHKQTP